MSTPGPDLASGRRMPRPELTEEMIGDLEVTLVIRAADPLGIDVHVIALCRTAPGPAAEAGR